MKNKYRVITDGYLGFEVQVKYWWFPLMWKQINGVNTHSTLNKAKAAIDVHKNRVVYEK